MISKRNKIKDMYIKGIPIATICVTLNMTKANFYYHKNKDLEKGISWDDKKYINSKNTVNLKADEEDFLNTLIYEFKNEMIEIQKIENPVEKLEALNKYVPVYYKLKIPNKSDCKAKYIEIATKVIYSLSELAISQENTQVANFLSKNSETIIEAIIKDKSIK